MVVSIHQPNYIPYPGVIYKALRSDVFVLLDDAQYSTSGMHNWNRIKTSNGITNLKIPVEQHLGDKIKDVVVKDSLKWRQKHLKTIEMNYKKADNFRNIFREFSELLESEEQKLAGINEAILRWILKGFDMKCDIIKSSELGIKTGKEERILDIVSAVGGNVYYSGKGAASYQDEEDFESRGIRLEYSDYQPKEYRQLWGGTFIPDLSILDYIINEGFNKNIFKK